MAHQASVCKLKLWQHEIYNIMWRKASARREEEEAEIIKYHRAEDRRLKCRENKYGEKAWRRYIIMASIFKSISAARTSLVRAYGVRRVSATQRARAGGTA